MFTKIEYKQISQETDKAFLLLFDAGIINPTKVSPFNFFVAKDNKCWIPKGSIIQHNKDKNTLICEEYWALENGINGVSKSLYDLIDYEKLELKLQDQDNNSYSFDPINCYYFQKKAYDFGIKRKKLALFMRMGLGKSKVLLDLIQARYQERVIKYAVVFVPSSTRQNFINEISKFCIVDYVVHEKATAIYISNKLNFYILSTQSCQKAVSKLSDIQKLLNKDCFLALDESHYIKEFSSLRSQSLVEMSQNVQFKVIMTGTFMGKNLVDVINQFLFLGEELFDNLSIKQLTRLYCKVGRLGKITGAKNIPQLMEKIFPYIFHINESASLNLPPKFYNKVFVEPSDDYLKYLAVFRENYESGIASNKLGLYTKLQLLSTGKYVEFIDKEKKDKIFKHPKVDALKSKIEEMPEQAKALIFVKFLHEIDSVSEILEEGSYTILSGNLSEKEKAQNVKEFKNNNNVRFLILTLGTGSVGLTLNQASYVFYLSNTFDYLTREQSEARCYRIGQDKTVFYYDFELHNSLDTQILANLERKKDLDTTTRDALDILMENKDNEK